MQLTDFDYALPPELIAHHPAQPRDHSRLMIVNRKAQTIAHDHFYNLSKYLTSSDTLVFNKTKVFPARLFARKTTGGRVEILLIRYDTASWEYISHPGIKEGTYLAFADQVTAQVVKGKLIFNLSYADLMAKLLIIGHVPLPPYIHPQEEWDETKLRRMYQTVYAAEIGSVAAPTAGFHFTKKLLSKLGKTGIQKEFVILHVGLGTFQPVKTANILDHQMHSEYYALDPQVAQRLMAAKSAGKKMVAVGTTVVRTLETWANAGQLSGETNIFIYPGYKFKFVGALITNFHLPKSTLLMLVSAFAGRDLVIVAYQEAIKEKYRFYSFGDAMLIL